LIHFTYLLIFMRNDMLSNYKSFKQSLWKWPSWWKRPPINYKFLNSRSFLKAPQILRIDLWDIILSGCWYCRRSYSSQFSSVYKT
jgi:hypothetical protein